MRAAVMQPTFLPWVGYFDLIDQVDVFVFLDTVQFEKQSWQQRNRVRAASGLEWLTVPVLISGRFGQLIQDVKIKNGSFPEKQLRTLRQHYAGCPHYSTHVQALEDIFESARSHLSLARLNIELVRVLAGVLGIRTKLALASELHATGRRSERVVSILREVGADAYVSPRGALEYLVQDRGAFQAAGISVVLQAYTHPQYEQRYRPFEPGASVVDLIFNCGSAAASIMRSGRGTPQPLDEAAAQVVGS